METELEQARKEIEYYQKIAERTGNLYLRETEELSKIIHLLKQTETSLMKSERKLRNIIEHSNELFYLHDTDHNVTYVSPQSRDFFGYTPGEAKVKWMEMMTSNPINQAGFEITQKAIQTGEKQKPYILEGRRKDGKSILLEIEESPVKDENGKVILIAGAARDITASKQAEQEKEKLEAQLRQSQKMEAIGTMAGGIAHDFNNILSIILGNTELAIRDVAEWHPVRESLEDVRKACLRAKDVIRQLLSYSRKSGMQLKPLDLSVIIRESLKLVRSSLPSNIEIRQNFDEDPCFTLGDPTQINQILINLSTNAADAIGSTGGILGISLENVDIACHNPEVNLEAGRYVKITISDTGVGISAEDIERIFDPYYTTKKVGRGTGMGLAVVYGIVETHRGRIKVSSNPGKGTAFEIFFPAIDAAPVVDVRENETIPHGKETILFVDDEKSIVKLNQARLERLGYQVAGTADPLEALEMFRYKSFQFDLVITDMTMPNMMGDELAVEMMKIRPDIPIILCTGFSGHTSEEQALAKGIRAFVMKPLDVIELAKTIRNVLDSGPF
ncbi:MAG: ATP-binding protein [Desulfobacterales bacterium]|jgi:PAS domain S-box-containing protein